jgi:hypothetical protein
MTTMPTSPTFTILKPRLISDLMTVAIEAQPPWLLRVEKLEGMNELNPFYVCSKFWSSPFLMRCFTKSGIIDIGQQELGNGLARIATKRPGSIMRLERETYTVEDALAFARYAILGDENV